jgi:alkanesulfonate monooxygenase SsuD/methylene tetrahydromethanopterin reductase-like flavin-dependent oxidoreductase (luciferase family)
LGVPYPPTRERLERLEETLKIAKQMWSGDATPFVGKHYRLDEPLNYPPALSKPHPPILIGGEGEKQTLRMVATYGDACNLHLGSPSPIYPDWLRETYQRRHETLPRKLAILREHCQRIGRDYAEIEPTVLGSIQVGQNATSSNEVVEACHELAEMGFRQVIYNMPDAHTIRPLEIFAQEIIPQVSKF